MGISWPESLLLKIKSNDAELFCYYFNDPKRSKTVIHFHGNGEVVNDYVPDLEIETTGFKPSYFEHLLLKLNVNLLLVEYRGYGSSTGSAQMIPMVKHDVENIFKALNLPEEHIILSGRSLGSIFAIHFAHLHPKVSGLIIDSGLDDPLCLQRYHKLQYIPSFSEPRIKDEAKELFNHPLKLSKYQGPVLIVHTADDTLAKLEHALANYKSCGGQISQQEEEKLQANGGVLKHNNKKLVVFVNGGHNYIFPANYEAFCSHVTEFVQTLG